MTTERPAMATPRVAAGVLGIRDDAVLLVRPSYKDYWDVPGGYVEPGESPQSACVREVKEELGIQLNELSLAAVDWAPNDTEGDKLLFLFVAPELHGVDPSQLTFPDHELTEARYVPVIELANYTIPRLVRRLTQTAQAVHSGEYPVYLEHGTKRVKVT